MAEYELTTTTLDDIELCVDDIISCEYSGEYKSLTLPKGSYSIECYGAQGGGITFTESSGSATQYSDYCLPEIGGLGGKVSGQINLSEATTIYLYVGGRGTNGTYNSYSSSGTAIDGGWNGGGSVASATPGLGGGGGGATDIRISTEIEDRIIVAGGGGGGCAAQGASKTSQLYSIGGAGGELTGENGNIAISSDYSDADASLFSVAIGGSQTEGGTGSSVTYIAPYTTGGDGSLGCGGIADGVFGSSSGTTTKCCGGGGGGGYYGGGGGASKTLFSYAAGFYCSGAGGSSYTSLDFTEVVHEQGVREGNGFIQITVLSLGDDLTIYVQKDNEIVKSTEILCKAEGVWHSIASLYAKVNGEWKLCGSGSISSGGSGSGSEDNTGGSEDSGDDSGTTNTYSITFEIDEHIISSNAATSVVKGSSYETILTTEAGYVIQSVTVRMGAGLDIVEDAYDSSTGRIYIETVTGTIQIIAYETVDSSSSGDDDETETTEIYVIYDEDGTDSLWSDANDFAVFDKNDADGYLRSQSSSVTASGNGTSASDAERGWIYIGMNPDLSASATSEDEGVSQADIDLEVVRSYKDLLAYDFTEYTKLCATISCSFGSSSWNGAGMGYLEDVTNYPGNYIMANFTAIDGEEETLEIDISDVTSSNCILLASPYISGSTITLHKLWFEKTSTEGGGG